MGFNGIPEAALKMLERSEIFRKYTSILNTTINWYNRIKRTSREVEFELIQTELEEIDKLAEIGQKSLTWNSKGRISISISSCTTLRSRLVGFYDKVTYARRKSPTTLTKKSG